MSDCRCVHQISPVTEPESTLWETFLPCPSSDTVTPRSVAILLSIKNMLIMFKTQGNMALNTCCSKVEGTLLESSTAALSYSHFRCVSGRMLLLFWAWIQQKRTAQCVTRHRVASSATHQREHRFKKEDRHTQPQSFNSQSNPRGHACCTGVPGPPRATASSPLHAARARGWIHHRRRTEWWGNN